MVRAGLDERVVFPGYIPDEDLPALLSAATAFVFPSLYEGFGIPILEAGGCGVPVITSNTSSLPEVAGDAALLVDPHDVDAIAEAMYRVVTDPELAAELRRRGHENVEALLVGEVCARDAGRAGERGFGKAQTFGVWRDPEGLGYPCPTTRSAILGVRVDGVTFAGMLACIEAWVADPAAPRRTRSAR